MSACATPLNARRAGCFNLFPLQRRAPLQRMDDRHGHLALAQVAGHRLAQYALRCRQVQHIVDNLEGHSQVVTVLPELLFLLRGGAAQYAPIRMDTENSTRSCGRSDRVFLQRDQLAELLHLQKLAFHHLLRQVNQNIEDAELRSCTAILKACM